MKSVQRSVNRSVKRCVIANWKMNMLAREAQAFCEAFLRTFRPVDGVEAGIAPPYTLLREVGTRLAGSGAVLYAQNGQPQAKGAFTGEIAMVQLLDAGCTGVILGHSERRQFFGETEETLIPKLLAAWDLELHPVLCIGETLTQRDAGFTLDILRHQLSILQQTGFGPLTIAYEPVWAIGTGLVALPAQIEEVHAFIQDDLWMMFGDQARDVPILYGGSVTPDNFAEILQVPHVAGGLVGGASLDPLKFQRLLQLAAEADG
jgi:triosephosphate isomerase (TIM)